MLLADLDGVVYISGHAVAGAPEAIDAARQAGMRIAFVTNKALRGPGCNIAAVLALVAGLAATAARYSPIFFAGTA